MLHACPALSVTVVDDDVEDRSQLVEDLTDCGFEAKVIEGRYGANLERLVSDIKNFQSDIVICDHKLQPQQLASFSGAELVANLFQIHVPAILLTMYKSPARVEILKHRDRIPIVVGRDEFGHEQLPDLPNIIELCRSEFAGQPSPSRRPHRVVVRVEDKRKVGVSDFVCDVVIPSWRPGHAVTIPKECFSSSFWPSVSAGDRFLGSVNIDAADENELFVIGLEERIELES